MFAHECCEFCNSFSFEYLYKICYVLGGEVFVFIKHLGLSLVITLPCFYQFKYNSFDLF